MREIIQGLWIGRELSVMEQMSISSFLANGHEYHLYAYEDALRVPEGAVIRDANEILPASLIFQYAGFKSYAGFSNYFRYKLLLEKGGWWADMDMICLHPFDFRDEYVFSSEIDKGEEVVTSGIIKAPAGSELINYAWEVCRQKDPGSLRWGETGPRLMAEAVRKFSLERYRKPHQVFCPISFDEWRKVLESDVVWRFDQATRAIHLWNEMWRREGQDKNKRYAPECLYEKLRRTYLREK
jgi:mannosyltransferase OCH1-like enzyme